MNLFPIYMYDKTIMDILLSKYHTLFTEYIV